jgi:hypothetical protein
MISGKLLPFLLLFIFFTITSCSSDDNVSSTKPNPVQPEVINPASQKLISIDYPYSPDIVYSKDDQTYEYDDLKRVNKISYSGWVYGVTYLNENLVEINMLNDPFAGRRENSKQLLHLQNGNITLMVKSSFDVIELTNEVRNSQKDSVVFKYTNNYLSGLEEYQSRNNGKNYSLNRQVDYKIENANIIQMKETGYSGEVVEVNYTYDNSPYIDMSDMIYETPFFYATKASKSIVTKDRIGKKSANNIIKIDFKYKNYLPHRKAFNSIVLKTNLDKFGRLAEVLMSGTTKTEVNSTNFENFTDVKTSFIYK